MAQTDIRPRPPRDRIGGGANADVAKSFRPRSTQGIAQQDLDMTSNRHGLAVSGLPSLVLAVASLSLVGLPVVKPAFADPHLELVDCVLDSGDSTKARYSFTVSNPSTPSTIHQICYFVLYPLSPQCLPDSCAAPNGWTCYIGESSQTLTYDAPDLGGCIPIDQSQGPFVFVAASDSCRIDVRYFTYPFVEQIGFEALTFACDDYTQSTSTTWGRVKTLYR